MTTDDILKKATKRPWRYHYAGLIYAVSHPESPVAVASREDLHGRDRAESDTNAELIVLAVNSFEAMMEALQWYADNAGTTAINYDMGKVAKKALALSEKKEGE